MRAKLEIQSVEKIGDAEQGGYIERITFTAVGGHKVESGYPESGDDEDNTYAKWTPLAALDISIANPALHGKFSVGQQFYVDFREALPYAAASAKPPEPAPAENAAAPVATPAPVGATAPTQTATA